MPKNFPTCSARKLQKIIEKHCGKPIRRKGSHCTYRSPYTGKNFTFADRKDCKTNLVRKVLVNDLGLTEEEAIKEVQKG